MGTVWPPAPAPDSKLKRYRRLSPPAGVYVSPLQLGGMSIGNSWDMGSGDKEEAFKLLDAFYEAGGNFIDNANSYHGGTSEEWLGEWVEKRGIRDQIVIATKYTDSPYRWGNNPDVNNAALLGNSVKSLVSSVDISLKRLRTNFIDILYVHWWDYCSSIEEVMNGLHNLVTQGKVLYLGASNIPAWIVAEANGYAKMAGKTPFSIYQRAWNVPPREFERKVIPMARAHGAWQFSEQEMGLKADYRVVGLALAPWNIFQQGKIRTDAEEEERHKTEDQKKMCRALEKVAAGVGASSIRAVALAYLMHKATHVFPVVGVRSIAQLKDNISALDVHLTPQHIEYLESILPFDLGTPHNLIGTGEAPSASIRSAIVLDWDPVPQPVQMV